MPFPTSRLAGCISTIVFAISASTTAQAQSRMFNVPAQTASDGVREFARQAGIQIIVAAGDAAGKRTNAVRGELDALAGLNQLLAGTGLIVQSHENAIVVLKATMSAPAAASGQPATDLDKVVVTGSRIARPELDSPMPVSVTRMDDAFALGRINVTDALALDPAIGIGQSLASSSTGWDAGMSAVNLRNLGTNRSLTLIDGQRRVSASARSSAVDLGMIPVGMIDHIEVVTGGAAAIYGADAVTGAVNIITRKDIEGINVQANTGVSEQGDANESMLSLSTGGKFAAGQGSFAIGGTVTKTDPLHMTDRYEWSDNPAYLANLSNTGIGDGIPDRDRIEHARQIYVSYQPTYWLNQKNWIVENGVPREALFGKNYSKTPSEFATGDGGDGRNLNDQDQLRGGLKSASIMGRVDFEFTENLQYNGYFSYARQAYDGTANYWRDDSRAVFFRGDGSFPAVRGIDGNAAPNGGSVAYLDNPYLPDALRQVMEENGLKKLAIDRTYGNFPLREEDHDRSSFTVGSSLDGRFTDYLGWQVFWQYGRTEDKASSRYMPIKYNWLAARDVIADPATGNPICRDEAARASGCVPLDIFSTAPAGKALVDYVMGTRNEKRVNSQGIFGAGINGGLFSLPAGEVSIALGVEHRKETLETEDDPMSLSGQLVYGGSLVGERPQLDVSFDVTEAYLETVAPLLSDLAFAKRLDVEAAYRYSDYSTVGGTSAWKVGLVWAPADWITFRGVRSRSVRTPNFGELYEPQLTVQQGSIDDPCEAAVYYASETRAANCHALGVTEPLPDIKVGPLTTSGGNPDLKPESSDSITFGVVLRPLENLSVTADYWDIDIADVITQFSYTQMLRLCVDLPTIDNVYCDKVVREAPLGNPVSVQSTQINASRMYANGIDFGLDYSVPLGAGVLGLSLKGTRLLEMVTETTPGISAGDVISDGGWHNPDYRATLQLGYDIGRVGAYLSTRYISSSTYDLNTDSEEAYPTNRVPSRTYNDLALLYSISDNYRVGVGVRNLFDVDPPYYPSLYRDTSMYDQVGRYFYVTANLKF